MARLEDGRSEPAELNRASLQRGGEQNPQPDRVGSEYGAHAWLPMGGDKDFVVKTFNLGFVLPNRVFQPNRRFW
jgi:hypothetical protein